MYDYNCSDCNEAKLQSDKNARKINEVINQVNALIQVNNETVDFIEDKANEVVGEVAVIKVNEVLGNLRTEVDNINSSLVNKAYKTYITAEEFGAKGDGVTDDTISIQEAINYAKSNFMTLKMSKKYLISNTLNISNINIKAKDSIIIYSGSEYAIKITNTDNKDMEFGEINASNGGCIELFSNSWSNFVQYLKLTGLQLISNTAKNCIFFNVHKGGWITELRISDFRFQAGQYGLYADSKNLDLINGIKLDKIGIEGVHTGFYIANGCRCWDITNTRHLESFTTLLETVGSVINLNIIGSSFMYFSKHLKLSLGTFGLINSPITKEGGVVIDYIAEIKGGILIPYNYREHLNCYNKQNPILDNTQFANYFLIGPNTNSLTLNKCYGIYNGINEFVLRFEFDNGTEFVLYDNEKNVLFNNTSDCGWAYVVFKWYKEVGWKAEKATYLNNLKEV